MLYKHYGQKVILLIDEYDVPLDKAFNHGYYKEMVSLIRGLFGQALKTNEYLQFAVLTGCLRISKESIFTGLNNFKVLSIMDTRFDEHFGFTDSEVMRLLEDYNLSDHFDVTKSWYDGYRFGDADVYCPWDVVNYVDLLKADPKAKPRAFWINTSGNDLVKRFVDKADKTDSGRNRAAHKRRGYREKCPLRTYLQRNRRQHRQSLECAFHDRIPDKRRRNR